MSDSPEFKFKLEIHHKGGKDGTRHVLAVMAMLAVLLGFAVFFLYLNVTWR